MKKNHAFTKVELAIVVATIAILAAIAIPNFLEPSIRIAPIQNDMRSMATGIETYFVDNRSYPGMVPLSAYARKLDVKEADLEKARAVGLTTIDTGGGDGGHAGLTTPIAYVKDLFRYKDNFSPGKTLPFVYIAKNEGWILISPGPDKRYDLRPSDYVGDTTGAIELLLPKTYDPTNGTVSGGDVWRVRFATKERPN